MENTSKVLARINSYIGNLESREKEQKLKKVTWTTSLSAALFLIVLVILYKPFKSAVDSNNVTSSTDFPQAEKLDISKSILIDTLTVTAQPELASLGTQETEPLIPSPLSEEKTVPTPKKVVRRARKSAPLSQPKRQDKLIASNDQPLTGVMRSSESVTPTSKASPTSALPIWEPDVEPQFPGGRAALSLFIQKHVTYPKIKKEGRKEGTVYVRFTVDKWGGIYDAKVIKGLGEAYDQEALNLIQKMPKWVPGKYEGQAVATYKDLGIMYKMY